VDFPRECIKLDSLLQVTEIRCEIQRYPESYSCESAVSRRDMGGDLWAMTSEGGGPGALRAPHPLCSDIESAVRAYWLTLTGNHEGTMAKKLKPVHPGEILREEFMTPLRLSMNRMAMDLRVPVTRIADIVNERRGITADTALRFALYFKTRQLSG